VIFDRIKAVTDELAEAVTELRFSPPVTHVYNPLRYARELHHRYLARFANSPKEVVLLGMNPGPWGMGQTGVPFGEVSAVRDWMGLRAPVGKPEKEHEKRPVLGLDCHRNEVSGRRLWGWARDAFGSPERFFERFFVVNYCPLLFLEASGRNRTPDKLRVAERKPLLERCDRALVEIVGALRPRFVVGVGRFAAGRAAAALGEHDLRLGRIAHPSPANPAANKGWRALIERELSEIGVTL
jgi:single-strand selective monofunctional uracil DNA glycosylase